MRGRLVAATWTDDGCLMTPARYRRPCRYEAFVPDPVAGIDLSLSGALAGVISDAEAAVRSLNASAAPGLAPLARLLLRTESIASSKVEGLQVDARTLARAEARSDVGRSIGTTTREILANIDAMQLAVEEASSAEQISAEEIVSIHRVLMAQAANPDLPGRIRVEQNWIGGNDHNPSGAAFVPPPPGEVGRSSATSASWPTATTCRRSSRRPSSTPSSRPSTPSSMAMAAPAGR